ncbi:MAG: ABC transporter permease [Eubacterium sp.]|nr:ABC transporter permease [Eubacterium sp.]MCM1303880.1 ABC transporter permease [Butyrivibrio sp.]MCM1344845.1 ABC transporter permease [Muribaculaceae bacterium]MCM1410812.1 ABC transporter permease [Lachnospiraceae bacterium]
MRKLSVEYRKQRHLFVWTIPLVFLAALFLWGLAGQRSLSDYDLAQGYSYLLYQLPVLNCILMPIMLAVISSRICDMEVKGQTWKLLFTLQDKGGFYDRKFLTEFLYLLLFCLGELGVLFLYGALFGYTEPLPVLLCLRHLGTTLVPGIAALTLQHILSLLSVNQIIPLLAGLAGSFLGLFSEFFPTVLARLVLWGYFGAFTPFGIDWDKTAQEIILIPTGFPAGLFAGFCTFTVLFYLLCRYLFIKKEV